MMSKAAEVQDSDAGPLSAAEIFTIVGIAICVLTIVASIAYGPVKQMWSRAHCVASCPRPALQKHQPEDGDAIGMLLLLHS